MKVKEIDFYVKELKRRNIPFTIAQTLYTKKVTSDKYNFEYTKNADLNNYELSLINKVRLFCEKKTYIEKVERKNIDYIHKYLMKESRWYSDEVYELDLSSAFWEIAKKEGIISEEIYLYGQKKEISKKARLVALGALAKKTTIIKFKDGIFTKPTTIEKRTSHLFFKCAEKTSIIMHTLRILANNNYFFFWCDAIFFRGNQTREILENYLISENINYKLTKIEKLIYKDGQFTVIQPDGKKKTRNFIFEPPLKPLILHNEKTPI